jgi:hypothetical protein
LLPQDERRLHDYIQLFPFLDSSFFEENPVLPDIYPVYKNPNL